MLVSAKGEDVLEQGEDKEDVWEPDAVDALVHGKGSWVVAKLSPSSS